MAATPASSTSRWLSSMPLVSPFFSPERSLTVTGRPEPSWAARATATAVSWSLSIAAPAPVFMTFGTGQPMFRSIMSASVCSRTYAAALRMMSGSWPKSWIEVGPVLRSSGCMRSISTHVFSLP